MGYKNNTNNYYYMTKIKERKKKNKKWFRHTWKEETPVCLDPYEKVLTGLKLEERHVC